ncbi:MAG: hypothetical protein B6D56_07655 [Candidatus Omnitrophica bacterium 4484_70.1]|nr:MAG: hypothetical protein B6D56_07655 [Candidatus Omnitrophica bacterium 4484_70.1]
MSLLFLIIIAGIVIFVIGSLSKNTKEKSQKENRKEDEEWRKLDEELEDYDYLDEITGKDDKEWI